MAIDPDTFLSQDDTSRLQNTLTEIALSLNSLGRQALLKNSGIPLSSRSGLHFETAANIFASELTAFFRTAIVSDMRPDYHPMINVLGHLLVTTPLDDETERLFKRLNAQGIENLKAITARSSVGRLESPEGQWLGTGTLVGTGMILTCYHILSEMSGRLWIRFSYKKRRDNWSPNPGEAFEINTCPVAINHNLDYVLLKLLREPEGRRIALPFRNILDNDQEIHLVHHPGGKPVEVSDIGRIADIGDEFIDHTIPALKGSSGGPLFDRDWHFIAIHRGDDPQRTLRPGTLAAVPLNAFWNVLIDKHIPVSVE